MIEGKKKFSRISVKLVLLICNILTDHWVVFAIILNWLCFAVKFVILLKLLKCHCWTSGAHQHVKGYCFLQYIISSLGWACTTSCCLSITQLI